MRTAKNRRGIALGVVILTSVVFSIAAYAVLFMMMGLKQRNRFYEQNLRVRYATEAGMVWATQRLWASPGECFNGSPDFFLDDDANPITPDIGVDIIRNPCAGHSTLQAKVVY